MKPSYSCMIVDDEPKAVELLKDCLSYLYPNFVVKGCYNTYMTALPALKQNECDVLFLDVSMPGKSGLDLLNLLPDLESEVIFVTAHSEHALSAIKFAPTGYILKPINDAQLSAAIDKAIERVQYRRLAKQNTQVANVTKIGIPNNKGIDYLDTNDILYFESLNNCTKIVTTTNELTSSYSLSRFKTIAEKHSFMQVHRTFIVNLNHIKRYTIDGGILMSNNAELPISRNYKEDFMVMFNKVSKNDV